MMFFEIVSGNYSKIRIVLLGHTVIKIEGKSEEMSEEVNINTNLDYKSDSISSSVFPRVKIFTLLPFCHIEISYLLAYFLEETGDISMNLNVGNLNENQGQALYEEESEREESKEKVK